ncbi:uncharacterized protein LOC143366696 [Andrena cerasifolii]|uniref:uncharacterized protein LOC143366696 n=1 Tax=Andrena cerasifolii TaxID=2819439 RepID=UPI004037DC15
MKRKAYRSFLLLDRRSNATSDGDKEDASSRCSQPRSNYREIIGLPLEAGAYRGKVLGIREHPSEHLRRPFISVGDHRWNGDANRGKKVDEFDEKVRKRLHPCGLARIINVSRWETRSSTVLLVRLHAPAYWKARRVLEACLQRSSKAYRSRAFPISPYKQRGCTLGSDRWSLLHNLGDNQRSSHAQAEIMLGKMHNC